MKCLNLLLALAIIVCAASAVFANAVKSDYDIKYNFANLKTFAFKNQRRANRDELKNNSLEAARIENDLT